MVTVNLRIERICYPKTQDKLWGRPGVEDSIGASAAKYSSNTPQTLPLLELRKSPLRDDTISMGPFGERFTDPSSAPLANRSTKAPMHVLPLGDPLNQRCPLWVLVSFGASRLKGSEKMHPYCRTSGLLKTSFRTMPPGNLKLI